MTDGRGAPADRVRTAFRERHRRDPEGCWSAPGRVNVIGEHTDYNDGYVLPFAIDKRATVAAGRRGDGVLTVMSLQRPGEGLCTELAALTPGSVAGWAAYVAGVVWSLREQGWAIDGLDVVLDSGVPAGSGLSSSAAIECAVVSAAGELCGAPRDAHELARIAQRAENDFVGVPCGLMDQMAAMVCTTDHALFFDVRTGRTEQVPFRPAAEALDVLVIDTRVHHALADGEYAERRRACETAAARLGVRALRDVEDLDAALRRLGDDELVRRTRHVVTENSRVLEAVRRLREGPLSAIGPLLTASHESLRDDFEVSCAELDLAVDTALAHGAVGARMTGGGFGGSAIALVPARETDSVRGGLTEAFLRQNLVAPTVWSATPSAGARRD